ncbi:VOC family protein [Paenibacillus filicis]|uniref:VOC family protein n=1 Tax=Paenibacillus gyeongsangnamensis TaxID=3388067 RepID=A0ABT4QFZ3_9BACL|nr:VOC family protein [Paenibacillus filicis]MCZ8515805.1 VOC family protein [Paenibacillus filicis]
MSGVHPATRIGHVHLKVSDLERSIRFYTEVLGFDLVNRMGNRLASDGRLAIDEFNAWLDLVAPDYPIVLRIN